MSHVNDLLQQVSTSVPYKTLGEVGTFIRGNGLQKAALTDQGVPAIHYGQIHTHYGTWATTTKSFADAAVAARLRRASPGDLVIATTSEDDEGVGKATAWLGDRDAVVSGDAYIYRHSLDPRYVAYFFETEQFHRQKVRHITGTKMRRLSGDALATIRIPIPELDVQRAVVRALDLFQGLELVLRSALEARRRQYSHYQKVLLPTLGDGCTWMTLGDIGDVSMCKRVFKHETSPRGDVPFYKIGTFGGEADAYIPQQLYDQYRARYPFPKLGDVLISAAGTIGRAVPYDGRPAYFQDSNIVWIDNDETTVLNAYLRYWYRVVRWSTDGGTIQRLYGSNLRRASIAVPPIDQQRKIVAILDQFEALVNNQTIGLPAELRARRAQYEYYRDKLLTFEEAAA